MSAVGRLQSSGLVSMVPSLSLFLSICLPLFSFSDKLPRLSQGKLSTGRAGRSLSGSRAQRQSWGATRCRRAAGQGAGQGEAVEGGCLVVVSWPLKAGRCRVVGVVWRCLVLAGGFSAWWELGPCMLLSQPPAKPQRLSGGYSGVMPELIPLSANPPLRITNPHPPQIPPTAPPH